MFEPYRAVAIKVITMEGMHEWNPDDELPSFFQHPMNLPCRKPGIEEMFKGILADDHIERGVFEGQPMSIADEGRFSIFEAVNIEIDIVVTTLLQRLP